MIRTHKAFMSLVSFMIDIVIASIKGESRYSRLEGTLADEFYDFIGK